MKIIAPLIALALAYWPAAGAVAAAPPSSSPTLSCTLGPVSKVFGGSTWLVYGCNDGRSVIVVSGPSNPAMPFYFIFAYGPKGMELYGEGSGNKQATGAAFKELKALSQADVGALFQQAKAHGASSAGVLQHNHSSKRTR